MATTRQQQLLISMLLLATGWQVAAQHGGVVECNSFDGTCPTGHLCVEATNICVKNAAAKVECNAFDSSCPKGLMCDKTSGWCKPAVLCGGKCDKCLYQGRCIRENQGNPVTAAMCTKYKGTWCQAGAPSPLSGCADSPSWTEATHRPWNCATYAPGKINGIPLEDAPAKNKACADKNAVGVPATKACPVSCGTCPPVCNIQRRLKHINDECCDEPSEKCSGGKPQTCNMKCAEVFMATWIECKKQLEDNFGRKLDPLFGPVHKMCDHTAKICKANPCKNGGACSAAIPNDHHGGHRRRLQDASSFVCACKAPWGGRTCTTCATKGYDPKSQCKTCLGTSFDPRRQCRACKDPLFDPQAQCKSCLLKLADPLRRCKACRDARYDMKTHCQTCRDPTYDPRRQCRACKDPLFDPQAQCKSCLLKLADPLRRCKACRDARYDMKTHCQTCRDPTYDPDNSCATKLKFIINAGVTVLSIHGRIHHANDAASLAAVIAIHPELTKVDLSYSYYFGDRSPLPTTGLPHVTDLNLQSCGLTAKTVPALVQSLSRSPQLSKIDLRRNSFTAADCAKLRAAAPANAVKAQNGFQCDRVDTLRNAISSDGHTLDLRYKSLGTAEASAVARIIATHPGLTKVVLSGNFANRDSVSYKSPLPIAGLPHATKLDLSSCHLTDKAVPALVQSLSHSPQLTNIDFHRNKFTAAGCATLRAAAPVSVVKTQNGFQCDKVDAFRFAVSPDGRTLDLSYKSLGTADISDVLTIITRHSDLTMVDLHGNRFGDKSPLPIAGLPHATDLDLHSCGLTDKAVPALAQSLSRSPQLTYINLHDNRFGDKSPLPTMGLPHATKLYLSGCHLTDKVVPALVQSLSHSPQLTHIDLHDNSFGDKSPLPTMGLPHATKLYLSGCHLTDKAVPALVQSLSHSPQLTNIDLHRNRFSTAGCAMLRAAAPVSVVKTQNGFQCDKVDAFRFAVSPDGRTLDLEYKSLGTADISDVLTFITRHSDLTMVDLRGNRFGDKSPLPIAGLPHATDLDLHSCGLTDKAVPALAQSLSRSPQLTYIDLHRNRLSTAGCATLRAAAPIFVKLQCDAHDTKLTDAEVPAIVTALRRHPLISSVDLSGNDLLPSSCNRIRTVVSAALLTAHNGFQCAKADAIRNAWILAERGGLVQGGVPTRLPAGMLIWEGRTQLTQFTDADAPALAKGIRRHPALRIIFFSGFKFQRASPLPTAGLPQVGFLDLRGNQLTDEAVPALVTTLAHSPQLALVDLSENKFSAAGCAHLCAAVPVYVSVKCHSGDRQSRTDKDAPAFAAALAKHPQLTTVYMKSGFRNVSPLPTTGLPHATSIIMFNMGLTDMAVPALVQFLKHSPQLGAADNVLATYLQQISFRSSTKRLTVCIDGKFSSVGCAQLKAALPNNHNLGYRFGVLCTNM
eukprot:COSAG01_NODE_1199_length_11292_cov_69.798267_9_plen_1418_part_00